MGKRVQKLIIYIFIRVSRDVVVPPRPLALDEDLNVERASRRARNGIELAVCWS